MCGIGGIVRAEGDAAVEAQALRRMAGAMRHRGPDGFGLASGSGAGFVSTRLAIFDIPGGWQPIRTRRGGSLIVYNGEVYNHPELRADLARDGVDCETLTDTEVVLRLLDRDGLDALERLNGQFAFAWWEPDERRLTLVRDRFGVRPLHYAHCADGSLVFASEAKGLFASGEITAEPDLTGIDDVFTLWGARAPRSPFRGVRQLRPGSLLVWERGRIIAERTWWAPDYSYRGHDGDLDALMRDSVRLRLRADVPVGTYLSGGLDSSLITALACEASEHRLRTFSVAFGDAHFDERVHQEEVAAALGTQHHVVEIGPGDIAGAFREVIRHAETPLIRTAPVPLYLLARATREHGITVVATGEGADELFWGYDLFKEVVLRLQAVHDESALEHLDQLYPYLAASGARRGPGWRQAFTDAGSSSDPLFSHQTRAAATAAVKAFYRTDIAADLATDSLERLRAELPEGFGRWSPLERTAYLEIRTLLEPYLLAAQGDRVAMAHGVEGRYPFLDHRVFEHSVALPAERKLDFPEDKVALRRLAATVLPPRIAQRPKQPYRAPEVAAFFAGGSPDWVEELLSPEVLRATGIFDERRVEGLVRRCRAGRANSLREGMALVGILSTQVWHDTFCGPGRDGYPEETAEPKVVIDLEAERATEGVV
ncbi:MAG: asparagine synthase (glutamine-hydrolyzing) [Chloroflexota bacterium]|nr:asparagine synthase (glutamine-hydrolyzing) [Chloroflexota bacterium]